MNDIDKEKDVDMEEVRRICSEKTAEELDAEFEAFKKEFAENKKKSKETLNFTTPHMKKSISTRCFFYILMLFSPEKSSVTVDSPENAPAGRLPFPHSAAGR